MRSKYLYAAPLGLVPRPSLSIAIGFAILASGYGSRRWSIALGLLGSFYAVFGTIRLGAWLDVGLLAASAALLAIASMRTLTAPRVCGGAIARTRSRTAARPARS